MCPFFGVIFRTPFFLAFVLPEDKKLNFKAVRESILFQKTVDLKTLQRFAGKTTSFCIAVLAARLYTRASFRAISSRLGLGLGLGLGF